MDTIEHYRERAGHFRRLAEAESSFRNAADVEASKLRRLGWIKEVS